MGGWVVDIARGFGRAVFLVGLVVGLWVWWFEGAVSAWAVVGGLVVASVGFVWELRSVRRESCGVV